MNHTNFWEAEIEAQLPVNLFKTLIEQRSKSPKWLLSVSPLALAACGGGGGTTQTSSNSTSNTNDDLQSSDPDVISFLTPLEQLTNQLAQSQGLQTQFTPGANIPNEKEASGLDPANHFDNSNKVHFYGYQWWMGNYKNLDYFYARGILGQYIICVPEKDLIIVRLGHKRSKERTNKHPNDFFIWLDAGLEIGK